MTLEPFLVLALASAAGQVVFALAQVVLTSASAMSLETRAQTGHSGSRAALDQIAREDRMLASGLVGTSLFGVLGVVLAAHAALIQHVPSWAGVGVYLIGTSMLAAALPHAIGADAALSLAGPSARLLRLTQLAAMPLVWVVEAWARGISVTTGSTRGTALTRQEIVQLFDDRSEAGIDPDEQAMIRRVFALPEISVAACMTPLVRVTTVRQESPVRDAVQIAVKSGHTRIPVCEGRVDHIVGVVHARDLLFGGADQRAIRELMRPVRYVPESKRVHELIHEMRRNRDPVAIVVDEYGGSVGLVTIEDLLEEIIGEIRDERDRTDSGIRKIGDGEWRVEGRVEIDALVAALGRPLPAKGDFDTVAGLVLAQMGRIPQVGEHVEVGDLRVTVEDASERAVRRVLLQIRPA